MPSRAGVVAASAWSDAPVQGLAVSWPSNFAIESGNDRIRVPVAW
jgi:hypothetical protein